MLYTLLMKTKIFIMFVLATTVSANDRPSLKCRVDVPSEFKQSSLHANGESESVRYATSYRAHWWNCVTVRGIDIDNRCPFMANGTPAAAAGARDGAQNADNSITRLLKKYDARTVREYLRSISRTEEAKKRMRPYFEKPTPERAP